MNRRLSLAIFVAVGLSAGCGKADDPSTQSLSGSSDVPRVSTTGSNSCARGVCARQGALRPGCCSVIHCPGQSDAAHAYSSCGDGCGYAWYEAGSKIYGPCLPSDSSCMNQAAMSVLSDICHISINPI